MIISGTNYNSAGIERRQGSRERVRGGDDFLSQMLGTSGGGPRERTGNASGREAGKNNAGNVSAAEEYSKNQTAGQLIRSASEDGKKRNREDMLKLLAEHREEILKKIKNGDTGVKIPIGSMLLTQEEWEKLLDSFDEAQEQMQEKIREENGEAPPEKRSDTTVNGDKLFAAEDTGHDLKPLEELLGESHVKGKTAGDPDAGDLQADEEDREKA